MKKGLEENKEQIISPEDHNKLIDLLRSMKYGSLTLVIQDGKVVQIDKNEKLRLR